jgi:hypothetical protein
MHSIRTVKYSLLDYKGIEEIMRELQIPQVRNLRAYGRNWTEHVGKMCYKMIPEKILKPHPKGKRSLIRPLE